MFSSYKIDQLNVAIFQNRQEMGAAAAEKITNKIEELLEKQNEVNIVFAAAPSQNEMLESLISKNLDWTRINAFHMDEYIELSDNAPQGFGNFLRIRLFEKATFHSVHYLNGNAENIVTECERYEGLLKEFPTDIVCMGIGENGHLAFNDPPVADFNDLVLVKRVELDAACRQQQVNDGCFSIIDEVPTHALTLTIPALTIGGSIFCVVPGITKKNAVFNTLHKEIIESYPSTILRKHPNAILFLDENSASLL